ncbi:MAG: putative methyltransferase FkbM family [Nitrososphaeraceae archaeon]|jgi:FkbM family methyltransferase|nr:putative methyltransferase FkbM family [Nitrososphaeraceae archaeon]
MLNLILWFIKNSEGMTIFDKCILFFLKIIYLGLRILLRLALGKKRRDRLYVKRGLDFGVFWYKTFKFLRPGTSTLLKFKVPKYDYEFYCRINKDDFKIMTIHEDDIIKRFTPKKGDIVIDIGAHIGLYTIISSKRVGANGKVVAIEADPSNFEMLNSNIKLNQLTNVTPLNYAAYSKETKIKLYLPSGESGFTKYNTIMPNWINTQEKFVEVNANTLDYLLQLNEIRQEEVNWIKIDVEGAEFEVLKGATNVLSKSKDIAILMELHGPPHVYRPKVEEFVNLYNFKIEFEKSYEENGSMHIIMQKSASTM